VYETLAEVCAWSTDPEERAVALVLLEAMTTTGAAPHPLPRAAYSGLQAKPSPEVDLLLFHFTQAPVLDTAVTDDIQSLTLDDSMPPQTRKFALRAHGHAATATQFHHAVGAWASAGLLSRDVVMDTVTPALAQCGVACTEAVRALIARPEPEARLAVYWALPGMDEHSRQTLLDFVIASLPPEEQWSFEERDQLAYLIEDAQS
jgi:hypothetical protein